MTQITEATRRAGTKVARLSAGVMLGGLLLQFLLGIYVNLYVPASSITGSHTSSEMMGSSGGMMSGMSRALSGAPSLMLHMMFGWLLFLGAIGSLGGAFLSRQRRAITAAVGGLVAIAVAGFGGLEFMSTGHDAYSFVMAIGFAGAIASYASEAYVLR